jgi:hypothetical protein
MATNIDYVSRVLNDILVRGLRPFVERSVGSEGELQELVREHVSRQRSQPRIVLDAQALLRVMERCWFDYFHASFPHRPRAVRSYINELWDARNRYAHLTPDVNLSDLEVDHILGSAQLLLAAVGAKGEAGEVAYLRRQFTGRTNGWTGGGIDSKWTPLAEKSKSWPLHSYTTPDGTVVVPFITPESESDYLNWTRDHPVGFVVNAPRPSPRGMKLHGASCGTINGEGKNLIGKDYFKVCSENKEALIDWIDDQMKPWSVCGLCRP